MPSDGYFDPDPIPPHPTTLPIGTGYPPHRADTGGTMERPDPWRESPIRQVSPPSPPPPPPPPGRPRRTPRRWWFAVATVVVVVLGAMTVILTSQAGEGRRQPLAEPGGNATAGPPSSGPSHLAGLGENPSPSPSPSQPGARDEPFPGARKTLPGASIHLISGESFAAALARSDRTYGPLRMVRVFYPGLPPSWNGSRADVANRTVVVSFKAPPRDVLAGTHDSRLAKWFASVPRDHDVYWSYFHEPENDVASGAYTTAQFRAAWRRVAGLAERAGNPKLKATLILMCWTLNPNSRRQFTDYYPGGDVVDVLGWDCYNSGGKNNRYTPPEQVFSTMINKSRSLGKPWGLAETGSVRIPGDSGAGRAAWIRAMSTYLNSQRPLWVAYYDYQVAGGDFRLTDDASRQAWRAWCSAAT